MLSIRLRRVGKTKRPAYRFVVADSRAPRDGAFVDLLGTYNPLVDPPEIKVDQDKTLEWINKGARPSETADKLLRRAGMLGGPRPIPVATAAAEKPARTPTVPTPAAAAAPVEAEPAPSVGLAAGEPEPADGVEETAPVAEGEA